MSPISNLGGPTQRVGNEANDLNEHNVDTEASARLSRRDRERQRHREEMLAAAEAVFSEKGYHGTTVEDVAARAEFSVGTLYNFFGSKEELYQAMIAWRCAAMFGRGRLALEQCRNPVEVVECFVREKVKICCEHQPFVRLYVRERLGDRFCNQPAYRETIEPHVQSVMRLLVRGLEQGQAEGRFRRDIGAEDLATAIDGLTEGFFFEWLAGSRPCEFADKAETMIKLIFQGVQVSS